MSDSPPIRRLSTSSSNSRQEELINAYEAEEERIINTLSRKLEKLREEKIELENALEAESESHVNRLNKELSILRRQQEANGSSSIDNLGTTTTTTTNGNGIYGPPDPSTSVMLEALMRENEQLRHRLASAETNYVHVSRLCEIYREELIGHRNRIGRPIDDLIGLSNSSDPYAHALQPTHHRHSTSSVSSTSSPTSTFYYAPPTSSRPPKHSIPIPLTNHPSARFSHHQGNLITDSFLGITPFSNSVSSSSDSPFPFSPVDDAPSPLPASLTSNNTHLTTPSSSASVNSNPPMFVPGGANASNRTLTYPSVPPPSLSSSPNVPYHLNSSMTSQNQSRGQSPVEPSSRRGSTGAGARRGSFDWKGGENGVVRGSRRSSVERGARVAEVGTLVPRSRAGSQSQHAQNQNQNQLEVTEEEVSTLALQ